MFGNKTPRLGRKALVQRLQAFRCCRAALTLQVRVSVTASNLDTGLTHKDADSSTLGEERRCKRTFPSPCRAAETALSTTTENCLGAVFRVTPRSKNKTVTFLPVSRSARHTLGPCFLMERVQRGALVS